jgi:hypothetical protein
VYKWFLFFGSLITAENVVYSLNTKKNGLEIVSIVNINEQIIVDNKFN